MLQRQDETFNHNSGSASPSEASGSGAQQPAGRVLQRAAKQSGRMAELCRGQLEHFMDWGLVPLRNSIPMPCMEVTRSSALRVRLRWHGFTQPAAKPQSLRTCEVYL